jgi:hypothetical protein
LWERRRGSRWDLGSTELPPQGARRHAGCPQLLQPRDGAACQYQTHVAAVDIRVPVAPCRAAAPARASLQKLPARALLACPWPRSGDATIQEFAGRARHAWCTSVDPGAHGRGKGVGRTVLAGACVLASAAHLVLAGGARALLALACEGASASWQVTLAHMSAAADPMRGARG